MFYYCSNLRYIDISYFIIETDKDFSIFNSLPVTGEINVNNQFIDKINDQIPISWTKNIIY